MPVRRPAPALVSRPIPSFTRLASLGAAVTLTLGVTDCSKKKTDEITADVDPAGSAYHQQYGGAPPVHPPSGDSGAAAMAMIQLLGAQGSAGGAASIDDISRNVSSCALQGGQSGHGHVSVTFAPDGSAESASVGPPFAGTNVGACLETLFRSARVTPYSGPRQTIVRGFDVPKGK